MPKPRTASEESSPHFETHTTDDTGDALAVRDAVAHLPDHLRELVQLVHWDGFTVTEAAHILGLSPSTTRSQYGSAKSHLRDVLAATEPDPTGQ